MIPNSPHLLVSSSRVVHRGSPLLRVSLNAPPVNALTRDVIGSLRDEIRQANAPYSGVRGILLTSALPKVFSAGLNLAEFSTRDQTVVREYARQFESLFFEVASSHVPTAIAVQGACPAGGCVLSLCCDVRIAGQHSNLKFSMGINESRVGLVPSWIQPLMRANLSSQRTAERLAQMGHLCSSPVEARSYGFLDEVVETNDLDAVESQAMDRLVELAAVPWNARVSAKLGSRRNLLNLLEKGDPDFPEVVVGDWFQKQLQELKKGLKKK
ncbi:ClpP/crotonase-like domain-containing protein [Chytriomyces sp. MP71]|nr:ClpP/crotonase-like domain-containing protein [Chytriomyces sp. MP71]